MFNKISLLRIALLILMLQLTSSSCTILSNGKVNLLLREATHQPEFDPYVIKFEQYYNVISYTPIDFFKGQSNTMGICFAIPGIPYLSKIFINKHFWDTLSYEAKLFLIFHEIAHCEYGLLHKDDMMDNGMCPQSLMNSFDAGEYCHRTYFKHYIKELGDLIGHPVK